MAPIRDNWVAWIRPGRRERGGNNQAPYPHPPEAREALTRLATTRRCPDARGPQTSRPHLARRARRESKHYGARAACMASHGSACSTDGVGCTLYPTGRGRLRGIHDRPREEPGPDRDDPRRACRPSPRRGAEGRGPLNRTRCETRSTFCPALARTALEPIRRSTVIWMRHLDRDRFVVHLACSRGDGSSVPPSLAKFREIPDIRLRPRTLRRGFDTGAWGRFCDSSGLPSRSRST